ncbi:MAG: glycerophosphodiester phosphodiesterase [Candidatus Electrothrix sp. AX5]|nr:glycerophosphodiester phosphodiesterase [Candidatus Electrothrix sp. AX5]
MILDKKEQNDFLCIAHRGAMGYEPENTLLSIRKALELKASWIEIDVHFIDNHLMVIHDDVIDHPKESKINIYGKKFDFLRSINVGKEQKIPILEEVLNLVDRKANLNIELKGDFTASPVCELIVDYVENYGWNYDNFLLSSFKYNELETAREILSNIPIGLLTRERKFACFDKARSLGACYLNVSIDILTDDVVKKAHDNNLKVLVYTVNSPEELMMVQKTGADGVFTNYIDLCINNSR